MKVDSLSVGSALTVNGSAVFTAATPPSKAHVGLSNVQNFGISNSTTSSSKTTYASSYAAMVAYNLARDAINTANTKLSTRGGTLSGNLIINNASPTLYLKDTNHKTAMLHCNSNQLYVLRSAGNNGSTWDSGPNRRHPMTLNLNDGNAYFSGDVHANGHLCYNAGNLSTLKSALNHAFKRVESTAQSVSAGQWRTIAVGSGRCSAEFIITDGNSGRHSNIRFIASIMYGNNAVINILNSSHYGGVGTDCGIYKKLRIRRLSGDYTYGQYAIEAEIGTSGSMYAEISNDTGHTSNWALRPKLDVAPAISGTKPLRLECANIDYSGSTSRLMSSNGFVFDQANMPPISDAISSTSTTVYASSKAAKTAYDRGTSAITIANGKMTDGGSYSTIYLSNWFRSNGNSGWYSQTHGGGIYMIDNTWVRIYGKKRFYVESTSSHAIHTAGGVDANANVVSNAERLSGNVNLNNYIRNGCYNVYATSTMSNRPPSGYDYGTMQVIGSNSSSGRFVSQLFIERMGGKMAFRGRNDTGSAWQPWYEVITTGNRNISSSVASNSTTVYASSKAVKIAFDTANRKIDNGASEASLTRLNATGTGNNYNSGGVELVGNGSTIFPNIGFHQPGVAGGSIQLRAVRDFRFYDNGASRYANITAASATFDAGTSTTVNVICDDAGEALLNVMGGNQGTGRVYVGQSASYGGGIEYNGDNSPVTTGAGADQIALYRVSGGTKSWTARNHVNSNDWHFRGNIYAGGQIFEAGQRVFSPNNRNISTSVSSTSTTTYASSSAVKAAYDRGTAGISQANALATIGSDSYIRSTNRWNMCGGTDKGWMPNSGGTGKSSNSYVGNSSWWFKEMWANSYRGGSVDVSGDITAFSDQRVKTNIEVIPNALDKVCQLRGVTFTRTDLEDKRQTGLIAQELEQVLPEAVTTSRNETLGIDDFKSVNYGATVGLLIEAIKELKAEVDSLKREIANGENKIV